MENEDDQNEMTGETEDFLDYEPRDPVEWETPTMYDMLLPLKLEWPSLTVEWLPDREEPPGKDYSAQKMILGTDAAENEPNYLMLVQVQQPLDVDKFASANQKVQIIKEINHKGKVNRARYMPQNQCIIATKTVTAEVYVFDYSKHPAKAPVDGKCNPDLRLRGHDEKGSGLSWSHFKQGHLLSGSDDAQICLWDINATPENKALDAMRKFKAHEGTVEDVAWHMKNEFLFGSVGEDKFMHIWDLRSPSVAKSVEAHERKVNCLSFNLLNDWAIATGSVDKTVRLFDIRSFSKPVHIFESHTEEVVQVGWNPKNETILASSCLDQTLMIWDHSRIGDEQTEEDAKNRPTELFFTHSGHSSTVRDFSWNSCEDWVMASVSDDNMLQIWQIADFVLLITKNSG